MSIEHVKLEDYLHQNNRKIIFSDNYMALSSDGYILAHNEIRGKSIKSSLKIHYPVYGIPWHRIKN